MFQAIPSHWTTFAYILEGSVKFGTDDQAQVKDQYNTVVLSTKSGQEGVALEAAADNTRLVLIAGEPLNQPVVQMGPFVMTTQREIMQAVSDFRNNVNGFENVDQWRSESAAALSRH